MIRTAAAIFFLLTASCFGQDSFALPEIDSINRLPAIAQIEAETLRGRSFRLALIKSLPGAVEAGAITQRQAAVIRLASFSPAFRNQAKMLGAIQMASSGVVLPVGADGTVDVDQIPWETATLSQWVEFIRIILELLQEFGILK